MTDGRSSEITTRSDPAIVTTVPPSTDDGTSGTGTPQVTETDETTTLTDEPETSEPVEISTPTETFTPEVTTPEPDMTENEIVTTLQIPEETSRFDPETASETEIPVDPPTTLHVHDFRLDPKQEEDERSNYDNSCGKIRRIRYYCTGCSERKYEEDGRFDHDYTGEGFCRHCLAVHPDVLSAQGLTFTDNSDGKTVTLTGMSPSCQRDKIVVPAYHDGKRVVSVAAEAFAGNTKISQVGFLGEITDQLYFVGTAYYRVLDGIESIGERAFAGCTALEKIFPPASLKTIGAGAFEGDVNLDFDLFHTRNLESIGSRAFAGCKMKKLDLNGTKIKTIGDEAFFNSEVGSLLTENTSLETIGNSAFEGCVRLETVKLPNNSLKKIGSRAFASCTAIPGNLYVPASAETAADAFTDTLLETRTFIDPVSGLECYLSYLRITVTGRGTSTEPDIVIPSEIDGKPVYSICGFDGDELLKSVVISEGIQVSDVRSFRNCPCLEKVIIPKSVANSYGDSFSGCAKLEVVLITNRNTVISSGCFEGCPGFMRRPDESGCIFRLQPDLASYYVHAINPYKTDVVIPESFKGLPVTEVGGNLWKDYPSVRYNTNLKTLYIPDSVKRIGSRAFSGCSNLTSVHLPSGLNDIPANCFSGCFNLTEIIIPDSVVSIGTDAFNSTNLARVVIPDSVTSLGEGAFQANSSLSEIIFGAGIRSIPGYAFSNCSGLATVTIPAQIVSIGERAFANNVNLETVIFENPGITIHETAFEGSGQFAPGS